MLTNGVRKKLSLEVDYLRITRPPGTAGAGLRWLETGCCAGLMQWGCFYAVRRALKLTVGLVFPGKKKKRVSVTAGSPRHALS